MRKLLKGKFPALLFLVTFLSVQAQSATAQGGMWGDDWHGGWGHMFFGSFIMLLFWGGLVILIVFAVRWMGAGSPRGSLGCPARSQRRWPASSRGCHSARGRSTPCTEQ